MLFITIQLVWDLDIDFYCELEPLPSKGVDRALDGEEPMQVISISSWISCLCDDWVPPTYTMQE